MIRMDALALSEGLAAKEFSATELMDATLRRVEEVNGTVNAVVSLRDADALMAEAGGHDAMPAKGWMHGIPIAIKDLCNAQGLPTSRGSPLFKDDIATGDDIMVARLRAAGAIVIGKTNTPEFGLGSHTFNPVHGTTLNPYDSTRTCGGSSGGAAVALATGMVSIADGSDMMGSLRNPAAWNNVYGMRPSWGIVPAEAQGDTFMDMLSTNGPMARSPRDMAALLDTMAGRDPRQPHALEIDATLPGIDKRQDTPRIGWLCDWGGGLPYEDGIMTISQAALAQMSDMGWQVEEVAPPFSLDAMWQSWIDLRSFAHGQRLEPLFDDPNKRDRLKVSAQWEVERYKSMTAAQVYEATLTRSDWFSAAATVFDRYDALVLPSAQVWPFLTDIEYPTEIAGHGMDTYHRWMQAMVPAALIGLPAVSVPVGFGDTGLPAGLQLIGRQGADGLLLRLAEIWHQTTRWPQKKPGLP